MPDVFISYAREDHERARVLAEALEARGWSVWWDRKIVAGQMFDHAIEQQLEAARCVVVLWSPHSVGSEWVRNEAGVASERGTFVPALLDHVKQPLEFRRRQAADLTRWSGDAADPEFLALCDGIAATTRSAPGAPIVTRPIRRDWRRHRSALVIAIAIAALTLGGYGVWRVATTAAVDGGNGAPIVEASRAETSVANPQPADTPPRSLAGRWNAEVRRTGLPPYKLAVDFEQVGDRLLGTVHYPTGDAGILDGRISGDRLSFRTVHTPQFESTPAEIRFEGRITGDTLELVLQDATGAGKVTARRAETEPRAR